MDITTLKHQIETNCKDYPLIVFVYSDTDFIPHQYIQAIIGEAKAEIVPVSYLNELLPVQNCLYDWEVSTDIYRFLQVDTLSEYDPRINKVKNGFIICKKIQEDLKPFYEDYIITVPKLEAWQIQDFIYSTCKGVPTERLDKLIEACNGNIFQLEQESRKIRIFAEQERKYAFDSFISQGIFSNLSNLTIFDLSSAIIKKDIPMISKVLQCIDNIDVEPIGLQKVLTDNFRDIILVQLNSASSPEYFEKTFGWKRGKYWAIKYSCGFYTREQLVNIFRFLCGIQFGDIPEDKLVSYLITHIISM